MINNSPAEYCFIRACIILLDSILPIALIYCALVVASNFIPQLRPFCCLPLPVLCWLVLEITFYVFVFLPRLRTLRRDAVHPELPPRVERERLFDKCHDNIPDPEAYISTWFGGAKKEEIKRENVKEFLRWAFLNTREVRDEDEDEIEAYTVKTEQMLGRTLPEGWGTAKSLRLTIDEVKYRYRSLLWYTCVAVVDTITSYKLWAQGFHFYRSSFTQLFRVFPFRLLNLLSRCRSPATHLTYWYRPHTSKTKLPVLFVHGIGIGLYPYTNFLRDVRKTFSDSDDEEVGLIALEIMPISFRMSYTALSKDAMIAEVRAILEHHGWEKVVLVTHSYGSVVATHLVKSPSMQTMIGPVVLIDPITFLLHLPNVAHNFTVRKPSLANEHQLWYFASQDTDVAHTLGRRFFWAENIMWVEDLRLGSNEGERGVTAVLAGRDLIVDTSTVCRYLLVPRGGSFLNSSNADGHVNGHAVVPNSYFGTGPDRTESQWRSGPWKETGLNVLWLEHLDHAQVFDSVKSRRVVAHAIKRHAEEGIVTD